MTLFLLLFSVGAITLTAIGVGSASLTALTGAAITPSRRSCILGICSRLSRSLDVPVRGIRFLVVLITLFTGILPGVLVYLAAGVVLSWSDDPPEASVPGFAASDRGPVLLGVCRRLAARLDVPTAPVRLFVSLATLCTGVAPGLLLYSLAAFLHTDHARSTLGRFARSLDEVRHDIPAASDRAASWIAPAPGPRRIGRYRILGLLGRGGMGSVWRGRDDALGRDAAVKVIDGPFGSDTVRRFGEEARAAAALASPHIVQIWEYAPDARPPFLAMEYVPGKSLLELVRSRGPQPVATAIDCARQVLAGLATAHAAGIVHRDIKPANILLATSGPAAGTYKLTDFGLARSADHDHALTATGTLLGTLSYLAPEVALGDDATPSSDLYALGATLHEVLVGRPPFAAESPLKLLRRIGTESIPPIASLRPDLPADVAAWLDRLVVRDPAARFQAADEALAALRDVAHATYAATDLESARSAHGDDAVPWHPGEAAGFGPAGAPLLPPEVAADRRADVLDRAMAFEADGRDALGEDSILDIARELHIDSAAVRAAILQSRRGGGAGVTQVFRRALGGEERGPHAPDRSRSDIFARAWIPGRHGADWTWRATIATACVAAFITGLFVTTTVRVARTGALRAEAQAEARHIAVKVLDATRPVTVDVDGFVGARVPPAPTTSMPPAESPEAAPPAAVPLPTMLRLTWIGLLLAPFFLSGCVAGLRRRRLARAAARENTGSWWMSR